MLIRRRFRNMEQVDSFLALLKRDGIWESNDPPKYIESLRMWALNVNVKVSANEAQDLPMQRHKPSLIENLHSDGRPIVTDSPQTYNKATYGAGPHLDRLLARLIEHHKEPRYDIAPELEHAKSARNAYRRRWSNGGSVSRN